MKNLTRAEEQVMQELWVLQKAYVKDIIPRLPNPKPAYNTISTIIRILERKGFVGHIPYGKTHLYYPIIKKKEYTRNFMKNFVEKYFSNSYHNMVSFFAKEESLNISELEEVKKMVEEQIAFKRKEK